MIPKDHKRKLVEISTNLYSHHDMEDDEINHEPAVKKQIKSKRQSHVHITLIDFILPSSSTQSSGDGSDSIAEMFNFLQNHMKNQQESRYKYLINREKKYDFIPLEFLNDEEFKARNIKLFEIHEKDMYRKPKDDLLTHRSILNSQKWNRLNNIYTTSRSKERRRRIALINARRNEPKDESLKKDREFLLEAVKTNGQALQDADESLQVDREFVLEALPNAFKKDREMMMEFLKQHEWALEFADESFNKDREFILEAIKHNVLFLKYADESLQKDRDFVLETVKQNGKVFQYVDETLKEDREIAFEAVKQSPYALTYLSKSLQKDREILLHVVGHCKFKDYLRDLSNPFSNIESPFDDKEIILFAIEHASINVLSCVPNHLKCDRDFMFEIIKSHPCAFKYASCELKDDRKFILDVVKLCGYLDGSFHKWCSVECLNWLYHIRMEEAYNTQLIPESTKICFEDQFLKEIIPFDIHSLEFELD